ncbi:MAG: DUF4185 domain-containing protein [Clostridia bacterium]|nr:DUF4185 domain-containing protein [Clostridia bacterium]
MNRFSVKLFSLFLISLFPFLFLLACDKAPAATGETSAPAESETAAPAAPADGRIRLVSGGASAFTLIRADNASASVKAAVSSLREYVRDATGVRLAASTDRETPEPGEAEIVVGFSSRKEKNETRLRETEFSVFVEETDGRTAIYLLGGSDAEVLNAVDWLVGRCLERDGDGLSLSRTLSVSRFSSYNDYEKQGTAVVEKLHTAVISTAVTGNASSPLRAVTGVRTIAMLTGEYSVNRTHSLYNVCGLDLGFPVLHKDTLWFFFGDTFSGGERKDGWRTNTAAYTTDLDYTNGIVFDGMYASSGDFATELIPGMKKPKTEYSKIPTGAISLGDNLYFYFMSVREWSTDNGWDCNYGGLAKSADDGKTWQIVDGIRWEGDTKFCQISPAYNPADGKVYLTGITGGRLGFARMMRVDADKIETLSAYEYLTGYDADGSAVWTAGEAGIRSEFPLIDARVSENTIFYNEYLGEWIVSFKKDNVFHLYTAKKPEGPYALSADITFPSVGAGVYGGFSCPALSRDGGRKIAFVMSTWDPCYNTFLLEITLNK